jgi:hypothetical protein
MPPRKKVTGSLNSKDPNPFEVAYKELWDKLPDWKKRAFAEDIANGRYDWGLYEQFCSEVNDRSEELYATVK